MQMEKCKSVDLYAFSACAVPESYFRRHKDLTIGKRLPEKRVEGLSATGQNKEKSHIVEGPQYPSYSHNSQYICKKVRCWGCGLVK